MSRPSAFLPGPHRRAIPMALALLPVLLAPGCGGPPAGGPPAGKGGGAPQGPPPATVRLGKATVQRMQQRWPVVGRLDEVDRTVVASELAARVKRVLVDEGDTVTEGQPLAELDDTFFILRRDELQAELTEARAAVARAQATVQQGEAAEAEVTARRRQAKSDYDYLKQLEAEGSARPREVSDAKSLLDAADAAVQAAEATTAAYRSALESAEAAVTTAIARLERAKREIERLAIAAPYAGEVVEKYATRGEWASPGSPIVEIVSTGQIDAELNVPEQFINFVNLGDEIEVTIDALDRYLDAEDRRGIDADQRRDAENGRSSAVPTDHRATAARVDYEVDSSQYTAFVSPLRVSVIGRVTAKVSDASNAARTFRVKVRLPDRVPATAGEAEPMRFRRLLPGMSVSSFVAIGVERDMLAVPRDAVVRSDLGEAVWVAAPQQGMPMPVAVKVPVKVLFASGEHCAIEPIGRDTPLAPGAAVVVEGAEGIYMPRQMLADASGGKGGEKETADPADGVPTRVGPPSEQ